MDAMTHWGLLWCHLKARLRVHDGSALVEYVLLVALIATVCILALNLLGGNTSAKLSGVGGSIVTS